MNRRTGSADSRSCPSRRTQGRDAFNKLADFTWQPGRRREVLADSGGQGLARHLMLLLGLHTRCRPPASATDCTNPAITAPTITYTRASSSPHRAITTFAAMPRRGRADTPARDGPARGRRSRRGHGQSKDAQVDAGLRSRKLERGLGHTVKNMRAMQLGPNIVASYPTRCKVS